MIDLIELRRLATSATPGCWEGEYQIMPDGRAKAFVCNDKGLIFYILESPDIVPVSDDVRYIAACNPTTIIALLDEFERITAERDDALADAARYQDERVDATDAKNRERRRADALSARLLELEDLGDYRTRYEYTQKLYNHQALDDASIDRMLKVEIERRKEAKKE